MPNFLFQVDTENTTKVSFSTTTEKIYSVKVMKTSRKSDYTVQKLKSSVVFATLDALLDEIKTSLNICPLQIGYIEPGHGLKGKQRWLIDDGDLTDMYCIYERKREITLWCQCGSAAGSSQSGTPKRVKKKRSREKDSDEPCSSSKKVSIMKKIKEVEEILKELQEKHGSSLLNVDQLNSWAHMIHTKKHTSYDVPPNLPYFKKAMASEPSTVRSTDGTPSVSVGVSPGKRVNLRSECISQLDKWHDLYEKQCITQEQYQQLRESILKDVFNF